ncbi:cupin domain-containing protein [Paracoccus sp. TOH]|jgi:uncharacterized cupin superfamily protein|uniref:cupin domain-containing protein n=1 Tax=Paracoccus sp. TOH TaxID=1263728 RepID=UPI0025AFEF40|nr:cupin domain-containing protein [Paracoccus sp. TOH]WJS87126.1 cupin domain-containing protein [Paracoccus sp. TOH]
MSYKNITNFSQNSPVRQVVDDTKNNISGDPFFGRWLQFEDRTGTVRSGVWEANKSVFLDVMDGIVEFCQIIEGEVTIKSLDDGSVQTMKVGDAFIMENGTRMEWTVDNYVKKNFVIVKIPEKQD